MTSRGALAQDEPSQQPAPQQGNSQPQQSPNEEKKDESPNPAQVAAEKTKEVTVQAAEATKKMGEQALVKARDWEIGWLTGVYVEEGHTMVPLNSKQRREIYLEQTLTTPGAYMKRMFAAGIDQARGAPSQWGGGWGGYGGRFGPRARHAIMRNFLTYNKSEQQLRPQWALYGGSFGGGLISTAWKPHPRDAFAEGGRAMLGQAGYGTLLNFFIEFSTDINRTIGAKKRKSK